MLSDSTQVRMTVVSGGITETWTTTIADIATDNADDEAMLGELVAALAAGKTWQDGGGAAPLVTVAVLAPLGWGEAPGGLDYDPVAPTAKGCEDCGVDTDAGNRHAPTCDSDEGRHERGDCRRSCIECESVDGEWSP